MELLEFWIAWNDRCCQVGAGAFHLCSHDKSALQVGRAYGRTGSAIYAEVVRSTCISLLLPDCTRISLVLPNGPRVWLVLLSWSILLVSPGLTLVSLIFGVDAHLTSLVGVNACLTDLVGVGARLTGLIVVDSRLTGAARMDAPLTSVVVGVQWTGRAFQWCYQVDVCLTCFATR